MADSAWETIVNHLVEASDEEISAEEVTSKTLLREDLDLGSLQAIALVMDLEENFSIAVEDEELEKLETVGDLHSLIETKLEEAPPEEAT